MTSAVEKAAAASAKSAFATACSSSEQKKAVGSASVPKVAPVARRFLFLLLLFARRSDAAKLTAVIKAEPLPPRGPKPAPLEYVDPAAAKKGALAAVDVAAGCCSSPLSLPPLVVEAAAVASYAAAVATAAPPPQQDAAKYEATIAKVRKEAAARAKADEQALARRSAALQGALAELSAAASAAAATGAALATEAEAVSVGLGNLVVTLRRNLSESFVVILRWVCLRKWRRSRSLNRFKVVFLCRFVDSVCWVEWLLCF